MRIAISLSVLLALVVTGVAASSPARAKVALRSTSLGSVLVDGRGHTLYLFEADRGHKSACYGACAQTWPPLLTGTAPLAASGVKKTLLKTVARKDGKLQVVYAGHPLYFFAGDARAGQTKGEGIEHFGGGWYAVSAAGTSVDPKSGSTSTTPPPYGGGGDGGYGPP